MLRPSIREIVKIVADENIKEIVLGLPINMDGTEGKSVEKVEYFLKMLKNKLADIKITMQDERLTTEEAIEILTARGVKKKNMKKVLDQVAAEIILKDYRDVMKGGEDGK